MSVAGEGAEAGSSREKGTLEWQLLQARSGIASLLEPPLPASAILHPLYSSNIQKNYPSRTSFEQHIGQLKSSIRRFIDEATTASLLTQQLDGESGQEGTDAKEKKKKLISLLRENSSHSAAITNAAHQLRISAQQHDNISSSLLRLLKHGETERASSIEEAKLSLQRFVQACETLAKDLKMEAFTEEHSGGSGNSFNHTHTLTLAASILVIDVEVGVEKKGEERWKPVIRLRLSYATDSGATKPIVRDHTLADCLKVDLQAVAESLLGYLPEDGTDKITRATLHYARARKNLETLKRLDDLSVGLSGSSIQPSVPDLFAALDGVSQDIKSSLLAESVSASLTHQINSNAGLAFQHIGLPYTTLVYCVDASRGLNTLDDIGNELDRQTLISQGNLQRVVYCISVTIAASRTKMAPTTTPSLALPRLDNGQEEGSDLQYMAVLNPPVLMPKQLAHRLSLAAGVGESQQEVALKKKPNLDQRMMLLNSSQQTSAPFYEDLLSLKGKSVFNPANEEHVYFAPEIGVENQAKRQGIMVSQFPFRSLENLNKAVNILREQVQINQLLSNVLHDNDTLENSDEVSLEDILNEQSKSHGLGSVRLCMAVGEGEGTCVVINVPLGIDIWTLEVRLNVKDGKWAFTCVTSKLGQESGKRKLEEENALYQDCIAILDNEGGQGLDQVLVLLRRWALDSQPAIIEKQGSTGADLVKDAVSPNSMDKDEDKVGPLPNDDSISPLRQGQNSGEDEYSKPGMMTRRRSSVMSASEEKEALKSLGSKRRASQAGMEDEDRQRKANRRKS